MAGLLGEAGDFIFGDDTTRDEYGQTQADRRMPYWSGLVKAGLLAAAGGQRMMPEQRAQYIAQAGGALAGIPQEIVQARSEQAKSLLAQQTIATNKNKLANQAKVQAYAATPEGQQALAKLQPHEQFAAKIAIDSGDIDAFSRIMGGIGKAEHAQQMADLAVGKLKLEQDKAAQKANTFMQGTNPQSQAYNYVLNAVKSGDPAVFASPEYRAAYDFITKDQTGRDANGQIVKIPGTDLPWAPTATYAHPMSGGQSSGQVTPVPGQAQKALSEKQVEVFANNTKQLDKIEGVLDQLEANPSIKVGSVANQILSRAPIGSIGADVLNKMDPAGVEVRALIANIGSQIVHDRSGAAVTISEYPRLAPFIPKDTDDQAEIRKKLGLLKREIDTDMKYHHGNIPQGSMVPSEVAERYAPPRQGTYVGPDNKPVEWADIAYTAEKSGRSVNDVIRKLKLKPKVP